MQTKRRLTIALSVLLCVFTCLGLVLSIRGAQVGKAEIKDVEIKKEYLIGDELNVSSARLLHGGTYVDVEQALLYLPSGDILTGEVFNLQLEGKYTLKLKGKSSSSDVVAKEEFSVFKNAYSLSNTSTCVYKSEGVTTVNDGRTGLEVILAEGDEFVFNQPVDISNCNLNETPVISFCPFQYSGAYDTDKTDSIRTVNVEATKFYVKLTDCYDSSKYVIVELLNRNAEGGMAENPWYSAGANGQILGALDPSVFRNQGYNGEVVAYNGTEWFSLYEGFGVSVGGALPLNTGSISIHYDVKTNKVYANQLTNTYVIEKSIFINDLSDPQVQKNPFEGFTTGEVYVSVYADGYKGASAGFDVTEICGISGSDLQKQFAEDNVVPKIVFNEHMKDRYFGAHGSQIKIKEAVSYDVHNLHHSLTTSVYYAYGTSNQTNVKIKDGKFDLNKLGSYTIEYKSVDAYGNTTVKTVEIISVDCASSGGKIIQTNISNLESVQNGGAIVDLPEYEVSSLNGKVQVTTTVTFPDGNKIEYKDGKGSVCFDQIGQTKITYLLFDGIVEEKIEYSVNVVSSNNVLFNEVYLPIGFIKDASYTLEKMTATIFNQEVASTVVADCFVIEDGKESEIKAVDYNDFKVSANESIQFVYKVGNNQKRSEIIKVYDVNYANQSKLDKTKYFTGDMVTESQSKYINVKSKLTSGTDSFEFINYLSISYFEFKFSIPSEQSDFSRLELILCDAENSENNVVISYTKNANVTEFSIGNIRKSIATNFVDSNFYVFYDVVKGAFFDSYGSMITWNNNFTTDKAILKVVLKDISGNAGINISAVGNQAFTRVSFDTAPAVICTNTESGFFNINDKVTIYKALATDVLTPYLRSGLTISVTGPNGQPIRTLDGISLDGSVFADVDYQVVLDAYGTYTAKYSYVDAFGQTSDMLYNFVVENRVAPTIVLDKGYTKTTRVTVKVGTEYSLVGYSVLDDTTPENEIEVRIFVYNPDYTFKMVSDNKINCTKAGVYQIYYYCYDAFGNYSATGYTLLVEGD